MKAVQVTKGDKLVLDDATQELYGERLGTVKEVFSAGGTYFDDQLVGFTFTNIPCKLFYQVFAEVEVSQ